MIKKLEILFLVLSFPYVDDKYDPDRMAVYES